MIELDLSGVKNSEYKNFDVGMNKCYVNSIKKTTSKNSGNEMLEVWFKRADGAVLKDHLVLTPAAMWRVQTFLKACQLPHTGKVSFEEKDILSRHLIVECMAEAYTNKDGQEGTVIKVKKFLADKDFNYALIDQAKAQPTQEKPQQEYIGDDNPL